MFRAGLYARVSTHDQQTLPLQMRAMREYALKRGWTITVEIKEVGSGAAERELREKLMAAPRRREIDVVLVWPTGPVGSVAGRSGRNLKRTGGTGCRFRIASQRKPSLDLTTPTGRAMAGLLSVFAAFEHVDHSASGSARVLPKRVSRGKHLGRPVTAGRKAGQIRKLYRARREQSWRSPAISISAAHPFVAYYRQNSHEETRQRSSPRGPNSQ